MEYLRQLHVSGGVFPASPSAKPIPNVLPCIPLDAVSEAERAAHDDTPIAGAEHLGQMPYVGEEAIPAACTSDATLSLTRMSGGAASIQLPPVKGPLVFWLRDDEFSSTQKSSNGVSERYCEGVVVATSTIWLKNRVLLLKVQAGCKMFSTNLNAYGTFQPLEIEKAKVRS